MVEPEFTWPKDIINHDNAGTDGADEIMESIERIGPRLTMQSVSRER